MSSKINIYSIPWLGWSLWNICITNDHDYVPLVVNTSLSFLHSWFITGFVTRLTRRMPLVEQDLPTLPENLRSPPVFSGVRVTRSLVLCVCFVDRCWSFFLLFFFGPLCRLPLCNLQTLLIQLVFVSSLLSKQHLRVRTKTVWLGVRITCPSKSTYHIPTCYCCFGDLAL
jgi:hypothetical protein